MPLPARSARSAALRASSGLRAAATLRAASRRASRLRASSGQATVEFVALLPLLAVVALGTWQVAVAGHAMWSAGAAARAAARAEAVGGDPERAARRIRSTARVATDDGGEVRVEVPIPAVVGGGTLFDTTARARFEPQR